jgi:hypothetical protein
LCELESQGEERAVAVPGRPSTPKGGRPYDIWIDAGALPSATVEKAAIETRTVYSSDYREVQGVRVPFAQRSTNGEAKYDQQVQIQSIEFDVPVADAQFAPPAPPPPDFAIAGGTSTSVPFELLNNHIYVQVYALRHGEPTSFPALAEDSPRAEGAIEDAASAKSEDVRLVKLETLRLGDATVEQVFYGSRWLASAGRGCQTRPRQLRDLQALRRRCRLREEPAALTVPTAFKYEVRAPSCLQVQRHVRRWKEIDGIPAVRHRHRQRASSTCSDPSWKAVSGRSTRRDSGCDRLGRGRRVAPPSAGPRR